MADDIDVTPGSGKTVATDEVSSRHYQIIKLAHGADGVATPSTDTAPFPVYLPATSVGYLSLAAIQAAVEIMDDWDETNRAAVNLIASQIGVQGGSGVVSANTLRAVLATDVGLPAGTNNIGDVDVLTVPTDPFGANADASSATGSISAKLRYIASNMALESAGNLAAIAASLSVVDDWDETNRAAVNPISGQAGVQGGAGIISATTQRVTIATDDTVATDLTAIKTAIQIIDDWDETDRAKINPIVGQAGVQGGSGAISANSQRVTIATDDTVATDLTAIRTAVQIMDDWDNGASDGASVSGDVAHDTADAGEPVKIGGKALDVGASPTAVTANDRVNAAFLRNGVQLVLGGDPGIVTKHLQITDADGAQTDTAVVTVSAGTAIVVTKASAMLDSATTATGGVAVRIGFGATNTPAVDSAGIILAHSGIAAGSGVVEGNGSGIIGIGASNEDLRLTCEDPAGGNLDIIVTYFTIAVG